MDSSKYVCRYCNGSGWFFNIQGLQGRTYPCPACHARKMTREQMEADLEAQKRAKEKRQ